MSAENSEPIAPEGVLVAAARPCPACAKPLPTEAADRCPHCGIALGEHQRCVHCRAVVDVEPAPDVRFVCRLCGGVRIPIDDAAIVPSAAQIELLTKATVARSATAVWTIVAGVVAAFGAGSVLVLALVLSVANPATAAAVMGGMAATVPFVFAVLAFRRSRAHHADIARLVEAAWVAAVADVRAREVASRCGDVRQVDEDERGRGRPILGEHVEQEFAARAAWTPEGSLKYTLLADGPGPTRALRSGD
jgi:hypothetical protein